MYETDIALTNDVAGSKDEGEDEENLCPICREDMDYFVVTKCSDKFCWRCSLRLRVLASDRKCPMCRTDLPKVVISKRDFDYFDFDLSNIEPHLMDTENGIFFMDETIKERCVNLTELRCLITDCHDAENGCFDSFRSIQSHLSRKHKMKYCGLCHSRFSQTLFLKDMRIFTIEELKSHFFSDHPRCIVCPSQFFDWTDYVDHCRDQHFLCEDCLQSEERSLEVFGNFENMYQHFVDHHSQCIKSEKEVFIPNNPNMWHRLGPVDKKPTLKEDSISSVREKPLRNSRDSPVSHNNHRQTREVRQSVSGDDCKKTHRKSDILDRKSDHIPLSRSLNYPEKEKSYALIDSRNRHVERRRTVSRWDSDDDTRHLLRSMNRKNDESGKRRMENEKCMRSSSRSDGDTSHDELEYMSSEVKSFCSYIKSIQLKDSEMESDLNYDKEGEQASDFFEIVSLYRDEIGSILNKSEAVQLEKTATWNNALDNGIRHMLTKKEYDDFRQKSVHWRECQFGTRSFLKYASTLFKMKEKYHIRESPNNIEPLHWSSWRGCLSRRLTASSQILCLLMLAFPSRALSYCLIASLMREAAGSKEPENARIMQEIALKNSECLQRYFLHRECPKYESFGKLKTRSPQLSNSTKSYNSNDVVKQKNRNKNIIYYT